MSISLGMGWKEGQAWVQILTPPPPNSPGPLQAVGRAEQQFLPPSGEVLSISGLLSEPNESPREAHPLAQR